MGFLIHMAEKAVAAACFHQGRRMDFSVRGNDGNREGEVRGSVQNSKCLKKLIEVKMLKTD